MRWTGWIPLALLSVGCLTQSAVVTLEGAAPALSTVKCIAVDAGTLSPDSQKLRAQLVADLRIALPGVEVTPDVAIADVVIQYQQTDMTICVDCGDANGQQSQYWSWFLSLSRREFDPTCGATVSKPF